MGYKMNASNRREISSRGGQVGHRTNDDLLEDIYYILLMNQIWLEGCNYDY